MPDLREARRGVAELGARIAAVTALLGRTRATTDPSEWYRRSTGKILDPWQQRFMSSAAPRALLVAGRQVGKTEAVSARAAYKARYWRRRIGVLSPTLRQSSVVYRRCRGILIASGATFGRLTATEMEVDGGGTIIALPGDRPDLAIRGDTLDDLIIDEAAFIRDALITAATPTLATKADATLTMLGTPAGQRGRFYEAFHKEGADWERIEVRSDECPRIAPEFLARERRRLGPQYEQEYCCAWLSAPGALFAADDLAAMFELPAPDVSLPEAEEVGALEF